MNIDYEYLKNRLTGRKVYFMWSGGDDSNCLLYYLLDCDFNRICDINLIVIPVPQHVYSVERLQYCAGYFKKIGMQYTLLCVDEYIDPNIKYADACLACKRIRRSRFLSYYDPIRKDGDVIITGHNLSDLMSYYVEMCIAQLNVQSGGIKRNRYLEVSNKFLPSYIAENGTEIIRPLIGLSQEEIKEYLNKSDIAEKHMNIISNKCFWLDQRKRLLQEYFVKAEVKSDYETVEKLFECNFGLPSIEEFRELSFDTYLF